MSLNNIELSPHLLSGLYKKSLVLPQEQATYSPEQGAATIAHEPAQKINPKAQQIAFTGNNQKNILIIAPETDPRSFYFFENMLKACQLSFSDIVIPECAYGNSIPGEQWVVEFKSKIVLLFGVDPLTFGLPVNFPEYQPQAFNHTTYLYASSLAELEHDKILRSKLWVCLKRIFSI